MFARFNEAGTGIELAKVWIINIELRLDLSTTVLKLASRTNLESGPRFVKVWLLVVLRLEIQRLFQSKILMCNIS